MILFILACRHSDEPPPEAEDSATDTEEPVCEPAPLPLEADYDRGYTGSEDFAFDDEGYLVSVDPFGNLVGINQAGDSRVILADATQYAAGMQILPDGDILFCDAEKGSLLRVNPDTSAVTVVLSGLLYPNGMDLGRDGMVYVAEQITGKVRQVDPDTGEYQVVARGLYNPNGVSFSPDEQTLYVGSFGAGVVWAVDREGEDWAPPRIYASTPESPGVPPDYCDSVEVGAECPLNGGYGLGECTDDEGDSYCGSGVDYAACNGYQEGAPCITTRFGAPLTQTCHPDASGVLFCPATPVEYEVPCFGEKQGTSCTVGNERGQCYPSWEGINACYLGGVSAYRDGCTDKAEGEACVVDDALYPSIGSCEKGDDFGIAGIICLPYGLFLTEHGGIDGLNVDACGNLYATEYILGKVWRFDGEGEEAQLVSSLRSEWIPNLHWGNGVGGWEKDLLYVMDRDKKGLFSLAVGVGSHREAP